MPETMRRMSSIPDPTPIFDHRSQMRRVDKQYRMLKKRLIIAGSKVRERLLREMRGLGQISTVQLISRWTRCFISTSGNVFIAYIGAFEYKRSKIRINDEFVPAWTKASMFYIGLDFFKMFYLLRFEWDLTNWKIYVRVFNFYLLK